MLVHRTLADQAKVVYACKEPKIHAMDRQRLHQSLPQNGPQHHVEVNRSLCGKVFPKINLDLFEQLHVLIFYLFFCIQEKHRFSLVIFGFLQSNQQLNQYLLQLPVDYHEKTFQFHPYQTLLPLSYFQEHVIAEYPVRGLSVIDGASVTCKTCKYRPSDGTFTICSP